ncbi:MAG: hypothetical protein CSB47_04175 [Proteobacteria bacterium]|nr:MAG: hypothetical protein CSB47_04175 [Pseudomonadota bacterium]
MNTTTVKRGIGAVILALIAAALLALLLKDKAPQRQDVVDMALPNSGAGSQANKDATSYDTLSTDNKTADKESTGNTTSEKSDNTVTQKGDETSDKANQEEVVAAAKPAGTAENAKKKDVGFSVTPDKKASGEFRDLDLVNNPNHTAAAPKDDGAATDASTQQASDQQAAPAVDKADQDTVIASKAPSKTEKVKSNEVQARLIGEKKAVAPKSSRTAKVITKKAKPKAAAPVESTNKPANAEPTTVRAKNGYTIQLLATSSAKRANDLKKVMRGEGYPTYVTKTQRNGKVLYRVRIGQYADRSTAAKAQAAMKRRYKKNTYVNNSAIVTR